MVSESFIKGKSVNYFENGSNSPIFDRYSKYIFKIN